MCHEGTNGRPTDFQGQAYRRAQRSADRGAALAGLWLVAKEGLVPIRGQSPALASAQKIAGSV
jgi:hypothetical protein